MGPANFQVSRDPPHHAVSGGGGDGEPSHGRKLKHTSHMLYIAADDGDRSELLTQQNRDCQRTIQINRNSPRDVLIVARA